MKNEKFINIRLNIWAIISLILGLLYIFIGAYLWEAFLEDWAIVMIVEGVILELLSFGLFSKHILPNKKSSFFYGLLLGVIGIIIVTCIKNSENKKKVYSGNKYEDLEKLQKLKENGTITDAEFEIEKSKLLS